ncbi:hypothetical protein DL96DRAFT_1595974, partial [Flagelloscypha sp. PMI_526]
SFQPIFELSASTWRESAQALSLVSKEVQRWTDPYLFQIVKCRFYSGEYSISLLDRVCMPDAPPRLVLARNYVRAIAWRSRVDKRSYIELALGKFPNLAQLCLWTNFFPARADYQGGLSPSGSFLIDQKYPSLRRVATCMDTLLFLPPNAFRSPFWMSITHLHINYYRAISSQNSPFRMPLLSPSTDNQNETNFDLAFSRVTATLPPSLKLCLLALPPPRKPRIPWIKEMVDTSQNFDERIVMWVMFPVNNMDELVGTERADNFRAWCGVQDGAYTYWEMGEAVLKKRQERRIRNI